MSSITDVVKEGLKYPFNDGKKVLTLGIILVVSSLVSIFMEYMVFDNMRTLANAAPIDTVQAAISALPPSSVALVVLSWIVSLIFALFCAGYLYNVIKYSIEKRSVCYITAETVLCVVKLSLVEAVVKPQHFINSTHIPH